MTRQDELNTTKGLVMKKWLSNRWHLGYVVEREVNQRDEFTYDCEGEIVSFECVHDTKHKATAHAKHILNSNITALQRDIDNCRMMLDRLDMSYSCGWFRSEMITKPKLFGLF